jgi:hypothetical protein
MGGDAEDGSRARQSSKIRRHCHWFQPPTVQAPLRRTWGWSSWLVVARSGRRTPSAEPFLRPELAPPASELLCARTEEADKVRTPARVCTPSPPLHRASRDPGIQSCGSQLPTS